MRNLCFSILLTTLLPFRLQGHPGWIVSTTDTGFSDVPPVDDHRAVAGGPGGATRRAADRGMDWFVRPVPTSDNVELAHSVESTPVLRPTASGLGEDTTAQVYRVTLSDGSSIVGTIISTTQDSLTVLTGAGVPLALPRRAVVSVNRLRGAIKQGRFQRVDPNGSRLLLGPTARPLKGGEGYFAAYEIFFIYGAVGVADFLSIGGGLSLVPGIDDQIFYLSPKLAFTTENEMFSGAVGLLHLNTFSGSDDGVGIVYGMGTYGTPQEGLTLGLGYSYSEGRFSSDAVLLVGGEAQVSNSFKLITENWILLGSNDLVLSFGFRFFGDNLAADLGFFYPIEDGSGISSGFPFLPWIGFAYNFWK